jgi:hypothetical protein
MLDQQGGGMGGEQEQPRAPQKSLNPASYAQAETVLPLQLYLLLLGLCVLQGGLPPQLLLLQSAEGLVLHPVLLPAFSWVC